jgi:hypothetical protein
MVQMALKMEGAPMVHSTFNPDGSVKKNLVIGDGIAGLYKSFGRPDVAGRDNEIFNTETVEIQSQLRLMNHMGETFSQRTVDPITGMLDINDNPQTLAANAKVFEMNAANKAFVQSNGGDIYNTLTDGSKVMKSTAEINAMASAMEGQFNAIKAGAAGGGAGSSTGGKVYLRSDLGPEAFDAVRSGNGNLFGEVYNRLPSNDQTVFNDYYKSMGGSNPSVESTNPDSAAKIGIAISMTSGNRQNVSKYFDTEGGVFTEDAVALDENISSVIAGYDKSITKGKDQQQLQAMAIGDLYKKRDQYIGQAQNALSESSDALGQIVPKVKIEEFNSNIFARGILAMAAIDYSRVRGLVRNAEAKLDKASVSLSGLIGPKSPFGGLIQDSKSVAGKVALQRKMLDDVKLILSGYEDNYIQEFAPYSPSEQYYGAVAHGAAVSRRIEAEK